MCPGEPASQMHRSPSPPIAAPLLGVLPSLQETEIEAEPEPEKASTAMTWKL